MQNSKVSVRGEILFCLSLVLIGTALLSPKMQNDTYWIINTGSYIVNHGFPHIDPFTIHEGLHVSVQQWLADALFYFANRSFGEYGIYFLMYLFFIISCLILYKICVKVSSNHNVSKAIVIITAIMLNINICTRPQVISQAIFLGELLLLEYYVQGNTKAIYALPLLSLILINFHAAVWPVFFMLLGPYLIDGLKSFKFTCGYGAKDISISAAICFAVGFINPYGSENVLYFLKGYGLKEINKNINEMFSPDFKTLFGMVVFASILLLLYLIRRAKNITVRDSLLLAGTLFMALSSVRSLFLFYFYAAIFAAKCFAGSKLLDNLLKDKRKVAINYIAFFFVIIAVFIVKPSNENLYDNKFSGAADYINSNYDTTKIRLYNDFESGGYLEYHGIKTFIDSRAELFFKKINGKEDIFIDYTHASKGVISYLELQKKYSLTHFMLQKNDPILTYLRNDANYKVVYQDNNCSIFEKTN